VIPSVIGDFRKTNTDLAKEVAEKKWKTFDLVEL
jgi:hypothetical protein